MIINAEPSNFGTINNTGKIQITCAGSLTGSEPSQAIPSGSLRADQHPTNSADENADQHADGNADERNNQHAGRIRPYYPPTRRRATPRQSPTSTLIRAGLQWQAATIYVSAQAGSSAGLP
ncbi:MAG: hypothetical protein IPO81_28070 [Kouleothrix sp.]|nr:hypothetical protein [Kouleothrix sp.]